MSFIKMNDLDLRGKRVLLRCDLNVPYKNGEILDDERIRASLPTIRRALESGAKLLVVSHFGRPQEGRFDAAFSLRPVSARLSELLGQKVKLKKDWIDGVEAIQPGEVVLCENVRFLAGEGNDDEALAKRMAALCDIYVMDAFGAAHRAQTSTHGVGFHAPVACAGPLLTAEIEALTSALHDAKRPLVAIVGGAKVLGKLQVLTKLSDKVDTLIVGGGIANTFLLAQGKPVGASLAEPELREEARKIMRKMGAPGRILPLPEDVVVAKELNNDALSETKDVNNVQEVDKIFDIGPKTIEQYAALIKDAGTVIWNGPLGAFEYAPFKAGTMAIAQAVAESEAFSVVGGGETVTAVKQSGMEDKVSYVSTGGGAFLEFLEGQKLPAIAMLEARAAQDGNVSQVSRANK